MCLSMCVGMGYDPYTHKAPEQIREMIQLKNYSLMYRLLKHLIVSNVIV